MDENWNEDASPCHVLSQYVVKGNVIITEILNLSTLVPQVFKLQDKTTQKKYRQLLIDFSYVENRAYLHSKIEQNPALSELDNQLEGYLDILKRFWLLFESIYSYISNLNIYFEDLHASKHEYYSFNTILSQKLGCQLLCQSVYLYGVMLLLVDMYINGHTRERMIVYCIRHNLSNLMHVEQICQVFASTGFSPSFINTYHSGKGHINFSLRPAHYPENYFARLPPHNTVINLIISKLRCYDIYDYTSNYPLYNRETSMLSVQASMIYVCLYFTPNILEQESLIMREIVDKFFPNNWVVTWFLGYTVDLSQVWNPYQAAYTALNTTINSRHITQLISNYDAEMDKLFTRLDNLLTGNLFTEDWVFQQHVKIQKLLCKCNITLRWMLLHLFRSTNNKILDLFPVQAVKSPSSQQAETFKNTKISYETMLNYPSMFSPTIWNGCQKPALNTRKLKLFCFLLNLSEFEFLYKTILHQLLDTKLDRWNEYKAKSIKFLNQLSLIYSGDYQLGDDFMVKNTQLQDWFVRTVSPTIESLDYTKESTAETSKLIQKVYRALQEVECLHEVGSNQQVMQWLQRVKLCIKNLAKTVEINEVSLKSALIITDASYLDQIAYEFVPIMKEVLRNDPRYLFKFRSTFFKLATIPSLMVMRIGTENKSKEIEGISDYYSQELIHYIKRVAEVIPKTIFTILEELQVIYKEYHPLPSKFDPTMLSDFEQYRTREQERELLHQISTLIDGTLSLKNPLICFIKIDPRQLLEEGIRKELVSRLIQILNNGLDFDKAPPSKAMIKRSDHSTNGEVLKSDASNLQLIISHAVSRLKEQVEGLKSTFYGVSDYIQINSFKIWREELGNVVLFSAQQECNQFLSYLDNKIVLGISGEGLALSNQSITFRDHACQYLPSYSTLSDFANGLILDLPFMQRLVHFILKATDIGQTVYLPEESGWFDLTTGCFNLLIHTFSELVQTIGLEVLVGLGKIYGSMVAHDIMDIQNQLKQRINLSLSVEESRDKSKPSRNSLSIIHANNSSTSSPLLLEQYLNRNVIDVNGLETMPKNHFKHLLQEAHAISTIKQLSSWLLPLLSTIGQKQLIRMHLVNALNLQAQLDSPVLYQSVLTFNQALLNDIQHHLNDPENYLYPDTIDNKIVCQLMPYLHHMGLYSPLHQVFIQVKSVKHLELILFIMTYIHLNDTSKDKKVVQFCKKRAQPQPTIMWTMPFLYGIWTFLKQSNYSTTLRYMAYMENWINIDTEEIPSNVQDQQWKNTLDGAQSFLSELKGLTTMQGQWPAT